jgi:phage shock protein C
MICETCSRQGVAGGTHCSGCGQAFTGAAYAQVQPQLVRPRYGRVVAGVCAGFAQQYGWDPILVRLILCAVVLAGCGSPVLMYLVAWAVIPNGPYLWTVPPSAPTEAGGTQAAA